MKKSYQIPYAVTLDFDVCDILTTSGAEGQKGGSNGDFTAMTALAKNRLDFGGNIMKKLTAAILALLICVFAFASCGSDNNKPSDTTPKTSDVGSKQEETPTKKDNGNETSAPESTREWSDRY